MSFENALHEQRAKPSAFQLTIRPDNIGVITIDVPGDKVNTLKAEFVEQVNDVLIRAQQHTALEGLVIVSGKPDSFIAGADITMIAACTFPLPTLSSEYGWSTAKKKYISSGMPIAPPINQGLPIVWPYKEAKKWVTAPWKGLGVGIAFISAVLRVFLIGIHL